ncbi:F-box protein [Legionella israelensis]|uniref:F-box-like domain-containing protein n=1 Tax=Legionella israelensis TaxID=454 RepID=UPI00117F97D6|nr:F-box-like domain-containing protein [Legionella israelensis]QDP73154.1 F-box protein [Legionella israelensis]
MGQGKEIVEDEKNTNNLFGNLPDEIALYILRYLDIKSLLKVGLLNNKYYQLSQDQALWRVFCFKNPVVKAFIEAADIECALKKGDISAYQLFQSIYSKDITQLKKLLLPHGAKYFYLWRPCYEYKIPLTFFQKTLPDFPHDCFLTEPLAKEKTLNAGSVKKWVKVKVLIEQTDLSQLLAEQRLSTCKEQESTETDILNHNSLPLK